jgi:uncharacterized repeat protein (TIGR04042 family)
MPEMLFHIVWPGGEREACYSPSLVVKEHFVPGHSYELADFLARSRAALHTASERVRARYGFACGRALGQLDRLERTATRFATDPAARVDVERFEDI